VGFISELQDRLKTSLTATSIHYYGAAAKTLEGKKRRPKFEFSTQLTY
jgi:hypothetical protein